MSVTYSHIIYQIVLLYAYSYLLSVCARVYMPVLTYMHSAYIIIWLHSYTSVYSNLSNIEEQAA